MGKVERLTKLEAARRQINAAIRMHFNEEDPVAIHAVVAGGMQIVTDLGHKKGLQLGIESLVLYIKPEYQEEIRLKMREPQNYIKHADWEGDEDKVYEYRPATSEIYLYMAAKSYEDYTGTSTPEMKTYGGWFALQNPHILAVPEQKQLFENLKKKYNALRMDKKIVGELLKKTRDERLIEGVDYS